MSILSKFTKYIGWQFVVGQFFIFLFIIAAISLEYVMIPRVKVMPVVYAGTIFIFIGLIELIFAILHFGQQISPFPYPRKTAEFRHTGIYSVIRHPMYSSLIILSLGFILFFNAYFSLILWVILVLFFRYKAKTEERYLIEKYSSYDEYRKKTKRFFPYIY